MENLKLDFPQTKLFAYMMKIDLIMQNQHPIKYNSMLTSSNFQLSVRSSMTL